MTRVYAQSPFVRVPNLTPLVKNTAWTLDRDVSEQLILRGSICKYDLVRKSILYGQPKYPLQYMYISLKLIILSLGIMTLRESYIRVDVEDAPITPRGTFTCILSRILGLRKPVKIKPLTILMLFFSPRVQNLLSNHHIFQFLSIIAFIYKSLEKSSFLLQQAPRAVELY